MQTRLSKHWCACLLGRSSVKDPPYCFSPLTLIQCLQEVGPAVQSAPPLPSRLFEALMMMNVPTFGTSSKSMQMPL